MARYRFTNIVFIAGGIEADADPIDGGGGGEGGGGQPPEPSGAKPLPDGFNTSEDVGYDMLVEAMDAGGLTPQGVQNHGQQIVDQLNAYWAFAGAGVPVWLSDSDAPVWPGFGSLDVTVDSGRPHPPEYPNGQWSFRPDGVTDYHDPHGTSRP